MPALPAVPLTLKVTIPFVIGDDATAMSRFYLGYSGTPPTSTQLTTFATSVDSAWNTDMAGLCGTWVASQPVGIEDLNSASGAVATGGTGHVGTAAGGRIPNSAATMIQYLISRRYRGGKPKGFWPIGDTTKIGTDGNWTAGWLSSAGTDWGLFIAAVKALSWTGGGSIQHVNVSYYQGFTSVQNPITHRWRNVPTLRAGGPVVDVVQGYSIEAGVASQRRRNVI